MSNFINKFFTTSIEIPIHKIIISFFALIIIRSFLENFSSPYYTGNFFPTKEAYLHFPMYYISVFLSFALVLFFFTRKSLRQIFNFELRVFFFILIPPIVDLIATSGRGEIMSYVITEPNNFPYLFFKLMDPRGFAGITLGIHVASYFIFLSLGFFIYKYTNKLSKALLGILVSYSILFFYAISPSLIAIPQLLSSNSKSSASAYETTLRQSWLTTTQESNGISYLQLLQIPNNENFKSLFDSPLTQLFFIVAICQLFFLFIIYYPRLWLALKRDLRLDRIIFWLFISSIGFFIEQQTFGKIVLSNPMNILSLCIFLILLILNIRLAICINDSEDIMIDKLSNPERPLIKNDFNRSQWQKLQLIFLALIILGISIMNHNVAFFLILAQSSYYIYSAEPFRFKRHFIPSSILIGIAAIAISMASFFLVSPDQHIAAFPVEAFWIIGISIALISNFKDIKDFTGDKNEGMMTMPVVFGINLSKILIALLFGIVFISIPIILHIYSLLFFAVCISIFMYYILTKARYEEKYVSVLLFIYLVALFFVHD